MNGTNEYGNDEIAKLYDMIFKNPSYSMYSVWFVQIFTIHEVQIVQMKLFVQTNSSVTEPLRSKLRFFLLKSLIHSLIGPSNFTFCFIIMGNDNFGSDMINHWSKGGTQYQSKSGQWGHTCVDYAIIK